MSGFGSNALLAAVSPVASQLVAQAFDTAVGVNESPADRKRRLKRERDARYRRAKRINRGLAELADPAKV